MIRNKTIVITGASSGIGRTVLEMLAAKENGNRIVAASRSIGKLTGFGENVMLFPCDLSTKEGVDALFEKAEETLKKIDVFFCNAGAPYYERYDYEDWARIERIFSLNTFSGMYSYSKYLNHLNGRDGQLVYTISAMGEMALPGYALYAATKFAMKGFQQAIRIESPKNLKITCVYPVATKTNFSRSAARDTRWNSRSPCRRRRRWRKPSSAAWKRDGSRSIPARCICRAVS